MVMKMPNGLIREAILTNNNEGAREDLGWTRAMKGMNLIGGIKDEGTFLGLDPIVIFLMRIMSWTQMGMK